MKEARGDASSPTLYVDALLPFLDPIKLKRRGAPFKDWRVMFREPILQFISEHPNAKNSKIAQALFTIFKKEQSLSSKRVIENWLSDIRQGRPGVGRKQNRPKEA